MLQCECIASDLYQYGVWEFTMSKIRFKYTKNHTYKCNRCGTEFEDLPIYCDNCARELMLPDEQGRLPAEYYDLFSPEDRGY